MYSSGLQARSRQTAASTTSWWSAIAPDHDRALPFDALARLRLDSDGLFARTVCVLMLVPTIWFSATDLVVAGSDPDVYAIRIAVRVTMLVALCFGAWWIPTSGTRGRYESRVLVVSLVCAASVVALNALRPAEAPLPLRSPLLWLFALYVGFPSRPSRQLAAPVLLTIGLMGLPMFWNVNASGDSLSGNVVVLLIANAIGIMFVRRRQLLAAREAQWEADAEHLVRAERALQELQTLKGIIPICSFCKKVRAEQGDWQQVERYVRAHSAADFSHGVCPECLNQHYKDYGDDAG